jgi:serine/threonine protein kinase
MGETVQSLPTLEPLDPLVVHVATQAEPRLRTHSPGTAWVLYVEVVVVYGVGDVIDGYLELIRPLSSGGFGTVFVARDLIDNTEVAVKFLDGGRAISIDQIRREVHPLRQLDHPNIVKVRGLGLTAEAVWFIVMELVSGQSLRELVESQGPMSADSLLDLGAQLLAALTVLHPDEDRIAELRSRDEMTEHDFRLLEELEAAGLVHRDVKPDNVIVDPTGRVVLVDFGIASAAGDAVGTISHSPGYVPPDLSVGALRRWDPDIDRYAAAATLWFAATGNEVGDCTCESLSGCTEPVADFLLRGCSSDRSQRFRTTTEMHARWLAVRRGLGTGDLSSQVREFISWAPGSARTSLETDEDLRRLLVEIVAVEQPIVCARLYSLARSVAPELATSRLNRIVYRMVADWDGPLTQVEALGSGQQNKTVHLAGSSPVILRTLGSRTLAELPGVELATHISHAHRVLGVPDTDELDSTTLAAQIANSLNPESSDSDRRAIADRVERRLRDAEGWGPGS